MKRTYPLHGNITMPFYSPLYHALLLKSKSSSKISVVILLLELIILINYKKRGLISDSKLVL